MSSAFGDDPLALWLRRIEEESQPAAQAALVERCLGALITTERYRDDLRFLRLALQHAAQSSEPESVFASLELFAIGQRSALFFVARAASAERSGDIHLAERCFESAFAQHAQPTEKLAAALAGFQARRAAASSAGSAAAAAGDATSDDFSFLSLEERRAAQWREPVAAPPVRLASAIRANHARAMEAIRLSAFGEGAAVSLDDATLRPLLFTRRFPLTLVLCGREFKLDSFCGRGAHADVYEAADSRAPGTPLALKVGSESDYAGVAWEFLILRRLLSRLPSPHLSVLFLDPLALHVATDCTVLVSAFLPHGSLLDASNQRGCMSELTAAYVGIELLRCLETLHAARILHLDIKPDNVLLRLGGREWTEWAPDSRGGDWGARGVSLIDFGCAIDLADYAADVSFAGSGGTEIFSCTEMVSGAPWRHQPDAYGACACLHACLYGAWMEVERSPTTGRWRCCSPLKRHWCTELWQSVYDRLLNSSVEQPPPLAAIRADLEAFLSRPDRASAMRKQLLHLCLALSERAR